MDESRNAIWWLDEIRKKIEAYRESDDRPHVALRRVQRLMKRDAERRTPSAMDFKRQHDDFAFKEKDGTNVLVHHRVHTIVGPPDHGRHRKPFSPLPFH